MIFLFDRKRILLIVMCFVILIPAFAFDGNAKNNDNHVIGDIDCKSAILMEAESGTVLYEYNADQALPPASVTKIMTLLLIMEEIDKGTLKYTDLVTTSKYAASMGGSQIYLKEGEQMTVEDMIKSVVIASANDAAVALAEHVCGSEEAFVARMNKRAKELGMDNTCFENTNGLDDTAAKHLVSARDIAIMSRELIKHEDILKYSTTWMDSIREGSFGLTNTNRLVRFYQGATGLKTGSTAKAKFCVSATAKRNDMHLICVVMGAPSSDVRNSIATSLLNWGFANFEIYKNENEDLHPLKVCGGQSDACNIYTDDFYVVVNKGEADKIEKIYQIPNNVDARIKKNQIVGKIQYLLDSKVVGESLVKSAENIEKIEFFDLFVRILSKFLIK